LTPTSSRGAEAREVANKASRGLVEAYGIVLLALVASNVVSMATAQEPPSRRFTSLDVFTLEYPTSPRVSPDGRTVAYVRRSNDIMTDRANSAIWAIDLATGKQAPLVADAGSYTAPEWSPTGDRLLYVAREPEAEPELKVLHLDSRISHTVARTLEAIREPVWSPDGERIAFVTFVTARAKAIAAALERPEGAEWAAPARLFEVLEIHRDGEGELKPGASHVFVVPADGGTPRDLTPGDTDFEGPRWLSDTVLLATANDRESAALEPNEADIFALDMRTAARTKLTQREGPDREAAPSPDGRRIAFTGYDDRRLPWQSADLYVMNADGTGTRNLSAAYDRPIRNPQWHPDGRGVYVTTTDGGQTHLLFVSLDGRVDVVARDVGSGSGGRPYAGGEFTVGGSAGAPVIVYTQDSWEHPADLVSLGPRNTVRRLTDLNGDVLAHIELATIEPIAVESSADGRMIDAWIAKPPGFEAGGDYPLILEIHGGPNSMYGASFSSEIQRYAAEGFVVVWSNPRGSVGYGEEFALLIDGKFPGEDYDDLMSVVDAVLAKSYADPDRLFVTGGSAGGTLTAWTVGKTDRFAAAAAVNPVINWTTIMLFADTAAGVARHRMRTYPWDDLDLFWRGSPISLAGNVNTPTLLLVGEADWRTPPVEAIQFYTALQLRGVDSALVLVPGASHNVSARPSQHAAKTDNVIAWFQSHDRKDENPRAQ
jgi:acylaminoacyl-peptidase